MLRPQTGNNNRKLSQHNLPSKAESTETRSPRTQPQHGGKDSSQKAIHAPKVRSARGKRRRPRVRQDSTSSSMSSSTQDTIAMDTRVTSRGKSEAVIQALENENKLPYVSLEVEHGHHPHTRRGSTDSMVSMASLRINPWLEFSEYIKSIDVDSINFQQKKFVDKSSCDFQRVMGEIETEDQKRLRRAHGLKRALTMAKVKLAEQQDQHEASQSDTNEEDEPKKPDPRRRMSVRAWAVLKGTIEEKHLEKKKNETMTGWNLLSKTLAHMTDTEKARQVLYERYIDKPYSWAEGLSQTNYPKFLSERVEKEKEEKKKKRPQTTGNASRVQFTHSKPTSRHDEGHKTQVSWRNRSSGVRPKSSFA